MFSTVWQGSGRLVSRSAMALALTCIAGSALVAAPAMAASKKEEAPAAPKITLSKGFMPLYQTTAKAIDEAKKRANVLAAAKVLEDATNGYNAATTSAARKTASAQRDAALAALGETLSAEKAQLETAITGATTPDDKYVAGQLTAQLAVAAQDMPLLRRGYEAMLASGKYPAAEVPKLENAVGSIAYDSKDYAGARAHLGAALAAGYKGNNTEVLLADSYIRDNQVVQGLQLLLTAIESRKASGQPAPQDWYRTGLASAYRNKLLEQAGAFSMGLVEAYPTTENWAGAISVLRLVAKYPAQESLDLMRLMERTKSFSEGSDYAEYLQAADARRLPGEVLKVLDEGLASGKLAATDVFVTENRTIAQGRVAADKASLPQLEKDSRSAAASAATAMAGGDAFLSYDQPAKAEELYTIALGKAGADTPRILTRLGISQVDQGKYADAQSTFAKVTGVRQPMARLWSIYAGQKAKGGA